MAVNYADNNVIAVMVACMVVPRPVNHPIEYKKNLVISYKWINPTYLTNKTRHITYLVG